MSVLTRPTPIRVPVAPLLPTVGAGQPVPLVDGRTTPYVHLDNAASAPALQVVADHVQAVLPLYASVHRGAGYPSQVCTRLYEDARHVVAALVGARSDDVVVFTRNTTDALNLLSTAVPGPVVVLDIEHHANLLPWQRSGAGAGARVVRAEATSAATEQALARELRREPAALLAVTGASNVTGEAPDLARLAGLAHAAGARIAVDAAQLLPHRGIDLAAADLDYVAFSGHKAYAPFGAGALIGRRDWLDAAPPYLAGGGAVRAVTVAGTSWAPSPERHEAGTPNVLGVAALAAAAGTLTGIGFARIRAHEAALHRLLVDGLLERGLRPLRIWADADDVVGVVSFTVPGYASAHVAAVLSAEHGIGVRDGRFCAHPLIERLAPDGAVRASLGVGSSSDDVRRLLGALDELLGSGPRWTYAAVDGGCRPSPDPRPLPSFSSAAGGPLDESPAPLSPCRPVSTPSIPRPASPLGESA